MLTIFYSTNKIWPEDALSRQIHILVSVHPGKGEIYCAIGDKIIICCMSNISDSELKAIAFDLVQTIRENKHALQISNSPEVFETLQIMSV